MVDGSLLALMFKSMILTMAPTYYTYHNLYLLQIIPKS